MPRARTEISPVADAPPAALQDAVRRLHRQLRAFIGSRVPNGAIADDLTQDVWVRVARHLGTLRNAARQDAWVYRIARHVVADFHRRRRETVELPDTLAAPADAAAVEQLHASLHTYVRNVVQSLPDPHREALLLTSFEGLSLQELADRQGISLTAAKSRVRRARAAMRHTMDACCHWRLDRRGNIVECTPRGTCEGCT